MLTKKEKNIILQVLEPYNPQKIGVFGSRVRNEHSAESDLDLLVQLEDVNLFDLVELESTLSMHLDMKVDLVTEASLNKHIRSEVENEVYYILNKSEELQNEK
ncbi:MAG: nucleotidyltransferase domain-containing protein [Balneolaceae bacterium]|nr:nucleotidyltransferase domain-containing protein [Balneolaceae bacterium]